MKECDSQNWNRLEELSCMSDFGSNVSGTKKTKPKVKGNRFLMKHRSALFLGVTEISIEGE